jgi:hypothetical protein
MNRLQALLSVLFVFGLAVRAGTRFILPHSSRDFPPFAHISDDRLSNFLPDTLKYTPWSEANGDSEFANIYHLTHDDMNNDVTSAHGNGHRNDATHRFDRLSRWHRIPDERSGFNGIEPFPPYANGYHLTHDDMNLGSASSYDNRNDASKRRFFQAPGRPRTSEDQPSGFNDIEPFPPYANGYHLTHDDMNLGSASSYDNRNDASKRRFFQAPGRPRTSEDQPSDFNGFKLNELDNGDGSETSEHGAKRRVGAVVFGDCTFSVDPSGLLTRSGSCSTQSGTLYLVGMSIKALAEDVFSNLSSVR